MSIENAKREFPLHLLIWYNDYKQLDEQLNRKIHDIEKHDPRGRTPLMLAVTLDYLESVRVLLHHGADVIVENAEGNTVVHEAVSNMNADLLQEVLEKRDFQKYSSRAVGIPELLKKIQDTPDFYVEIKWEFTSWVPLVSRMCPSDVYRVYKSGSSVRIDTTLLGFYQSKWQRGNRSYIFKGQDDGAVIMEVNHDAHQVYVEHMRSLPAHMMGMMVTISPSSEAIAARFALPIVTTYVDTEKIKFDRLRSGIFGRRNAKSVNINGYDCKVYTASNVELVTKTRTEHLSDAQKKKYKASRSPLQAFLGIMEVDEKSTMHAAYGDSKGNPCHITPEEYFDGSVDLKGRDIGRPREVTTKIQKFKGSLWVSENYPLSLRDQLLPIVDLMAISNRHFARLRDFMVNQLPPGFPVKIEIPLFRVLHARITFSNVFGMESPVLGVTPVDSDSLSCIVEDLCFDVPDEYATFGSTRRLVKRQPRTAEEREQSKDKKRQELLTKYHVSKQPSVETPSPGTSAVNSPTSPTVAAAVASIPSTSNAPSNGHSWRQMARRIRLLFGKH